MKTAALRGATQKKRQQQQDATRKRCQFRPTWKKKGNGKDLKKKTPHPDRPRVWKVTGN